MKQSDKLMSLFDNLSAENQSYALAILQSLKYAQDTMSKQPQASNKGINGVPAKNNENEPPT